MKNTENYLAELKEIRKMMEESSRFLSLSGLSGILVGVYALVGSFLAFKMDQSDNLFGTLLSDLVVPQMFFLAVAVLILSLITIVILTLRRAKKAGKKFWNPGSRLMMLNLAIPLISGGILILIFVFREYYEIIASGCLVFYGLALINAAKFTRQEIFYLGLFQVTLGILAAILPALGLLFWALGFGILHIIYGSLMYSRYEHKTNS